MLFVTSDHHFGHANIIKYCNRPFLHDYGTGPVAGSPDVAAMDRYLVDQWNAVVGPADVVWHLGDFAFGKRDNIVLMASLLHGKKYIIQGNHDRANWNVYSEAGFEKLVMPIEHRQGFMLKDIGNGKQVFVSHRPPLEQDAACAFGWFPSAVAWLHGHTHGKYGIHSFAQDRRIMDMSVDAWDFQPVSLDRILQEIA